MNMDPIINGGIAFAAVLILMVLNIPIGIAMLLVGFTGFAIISGFDPAIFVLGTAPFDAVSKYTLSVLPLFVEDEATVFFSLIFYLTDLSLYPRSKKKIAITPKTKPPIGAPYPTPPPALLVNAELTN